MNPMPYPMPIYVGDGGGSTDVGPWWFWLGYLAVVLFLWPWFAYIVWERILRDDAIDKDGRPDGGCWFLLIVFGLCAAALWPLTALGYLVYRRVSRWIDRDRAKERESA